ncbi:MAG TPA: GntR family transcriptional regulator [Planctomycetes bacterium]|nr:GntR family transcriptional regulator [Planctomycetota bacterium]
MGVPENKYFTITATLERDIRTGKLTGFLPPVTALAQNHNCAVVTARKAVARLKNSGLVETVTGVGTKILPPRRAKTGLVGVACDQDTGFLRRYSFTLEMMLGLMETLSGAGMRLVMLEREVFDNPQDIGGMDALIIIESFNEERIKRLSRISPMAVLDGPEKLEYADCFVIDNYEIGAMAARVLAGAGKKKPGYFSKAAKSSSSDPAWDARERGFVEEMARLGAGKAFMPEIPRSRPEIYVEAVLNAIRKHPVDAAVVTGPEAAGYLLQHSAETGLEAEDIIVIAQQERCQGLHTYVISMDFVELGRTAGRRIIERLHEWPQTLPCDSHVLPPETYSPDRNKTRLDANENSSSEPSKS